ncbi:protoporphyrinogen/coproporphyrinogen oxidase [Gulosibacter chungangensis]|uniref:protoporphyrinogen/coproporphyrinogen oxidase n=1 Tax=Gulosibacter chungangensis TaxID=979746 RepID=UPI001787FB3D|nr:FAD-dependent oxidoreductase [Gulosibacter chungangensis]
MGASGAGLGSAGAGDLDAAATSVAVIGGGVAGLVAARRLALAGVAVTVFEASDALGGMIQPGHLGELTIDIGAEAFAVRGGAVEAFIRELGLEDALVEPRALGSWTYGASGAHPSPAGGMLGIPSGPDAPGLEAVIGAEVLSAVAAEATLDASVGADAESFADLIRARFGSLVLERLVAPVTRGVYSLDPELVDHRVLIPGLVEKLAAHGSLSAVVSSMRPKATPGALVRGLRGGMHRFVAALVADCERLGVRFELGTRVTLADLALVERPHADLPVAEWPRSGRIEASPFDTLRYSGNAFDTLRYSGNAFDTHRYSGNGTGSRDDFDFVIATVESAVAAGDAAPPVSSEVVALLVDAPELDAHPRGTGVLVSDATDVAAKALTHVTAKWAWLDELTAAGQHVIRLSYGPRQTDGPARSLELDDAALASQALADASRILGTELTDENLVALARQEWRMPMPAARLGRTAQLARYRERFDADPRIQLCGAWIDGTGLASVLPSAENAAQRILASLGLA